MANRWWENETPITIESSKNVIKWFPRALKLQVSRPNWTDNNGEEKMGKTVVLDVAALEGIEGAADIFREAANALYEAEGQQP